MLKVTGNGSSTTCDGVTRRDFLQAGTLGALGFSMANFAALQALGDTAKKQSDKACILIFNLGGPSQLDTFDPKPDAPREIRGPFKAIRTASPDIQLTELLPLHAKLADKFSLVRSCHHTAAAIHDTGHQMMQTGRLFQGGLNTPHAGCALEFLRGRKTELPAHAILPEAMGPTGGGLAHGQDAGFLGKNYDPFVLGADPAGMHFKLPGFAWPENGNAFDLAKEPEKVRERYGMTRFGQCCLLARRLVEAGVRFVTINTFLTVFDEISWDIHGSKPFTSMDGMKDIVAPMYDQGYSALIEDLVQRGMLDSTLVTGLAEFGRTPRINAAGGRDHWPQCWTVSFAGGGVKGGRVIGKSDDIGGYPAERPVTPQEIVATLYHSLGLDLATHLPGPDGCPVPLVDFGTQPIRELF